MKSEERDAAYLWDMLRACREILEFTGDVDHAAFVNDRKLVLAVERCLEIVGEAAARISDSLRETHETIPWQKVRGMRNFLAHEYGRVDVDILYATAVEEIPELVCQVEMLMMRLGVEAGMDGDVIAP